MTKVDRFLTVMKDTKARMYRQHGKYSVTCFDIGEYFRQLLKAYEPPKHREQYTCLYLLSYWNRLKGLSFQADQTINVAATIQKDDKLIRNPEHNIVIQDQNTTISMK